MLKRKGTNNKKQRGAAAVEYMALVGGIGLAIMVGAQDLGNAVSAKLSGIADRVNTIG